VAEEDRRTRFFPYTSMISHQSFQDIGDELRNQYSTRISPTTISWDGKYHRIRIEGPTTRATGARRFADISPRPTWTGTNPPLRKLGSGSVSGKR